MGGVVTIGLLMMSFGAMLKGRRESAGAWGSSCACLNVSPEPKVLALFGGMRRTNGFGVEKLVVSVSNIGAEEG